MDYNKPLDLLHMAQETKWVDKVNMARVDGHLCSWATGFHPRNLSCRLHGGFLNGSYNVSQKLVFDDGTTWLLRLPRASRVSPEYADEKIAMEVEALHVIREKTSLPVPEVYAWGLARENRLGDRTNGFSTTRDYSEYVISQDWRQLRLQPNSIAGPHSARSRYASLKILESLIPELTHPTYDHAPFKLICDDFGLGNVIQFGSAPWWLLMDRPLKEEWDFDEDDAPEATDRYFKYLEIFIRMLSDEEAMWLHMLLSSDLFDTPTFPCMRLRKFKGAEWWDERLKENGDTEEVETFVASKLEDLAAYDKIKDKVEHFKALMDSKEITTTDFISSVYSLLRSAQEKCSD
ncbi:hypothetical protein OAory_01067130 [Aspergillus oryzae]|uniref:Aminoglycoside phosphotransferase domain-containing protein n=1 Tax=Aspergillus oryzae TaxID=5062 RepID=A0A1S9D7W3_ASPOZ|nr:hypothetical protein OAory_01067130 [Aspergillus oryzae]